MDETVTAVLARKQLNKIIPLFSLLEAYNKTSIFIHVDIKEDVLNCSRGKFWGVQAQEIRTWKLYTGGFKNLGRIAKNLFTRVEMFVKWLVSRARPGQPNLHLFLSA